MSHRLGAAAVVLAALALWSPDQARAEDLLGNFVGLYVGAAAGQAEARANEPGFGLGTGLRFDERATGWKVLLGIRPIPIVGAELEYVDFGHPSVLPAAGIGFATAADSHPRATTLSGLLYAPLPLPILDLYGKVGLSRLRTDVHANVVCFGTCPLIVPPPFALDRTTTNFAYGAGVQLKFSALALRLEYERISASAGDPDLLSAGFTYTF